MKIVQTLLIGLGLLCSSDMLADCCNTPAGHCSNKFMVRSCKKSGIKKAPTLIDPSTGKNVAVDATTGACPKCSTNSAYHLATDHTCDSSGNQLSGNNLVYVDANC